MSTEAECRPVVRVAPLVPLALAVAAGVATDRFGVAWSTTAWASLALLACAVAAIGVVRRRGEVAQVMALLVALGALGGGWHHFRWADLAADDLARGVDETPRPAWVRGVLGEVLGFRPGEFPGEGGATRAVLDLTGLNDGRRWHRISGRASLRVAGDRTDLAAGRAIEAAGSLAKIAGPLNPGEFDVRNALRARGIRLAMTVDDPTGVWGDPGSPGSLRWRWLGAARAWSYSRLVAGLNPRAAPLAAALLLGRREAVDPEVNDAFARTGTTHLLAISGLHLQALAVALWLVFRVLGLPRRGAFALVALATVAYALLVGGAPSVVRSAVMTVTVCIAGILDRSPRPANLLALAALVTLLFNPAHLFDAGCQLSFLAVAAVFWGIPLLAHVFAFPGFHLLDRYRPLDPLDALERRLEPWWRSAARKGREFLLEGLMLSVAAWLVTAPLVSLRFHLVSPIGILLNIPLIPLTSLALLASGLTLVLSAIWTPLGMPSAWICGGLLDLTERITRWGAARPWGHRFVAGPSWAWVLGLYVLLAWMTAAGIGRWPARRWARGALVGWLVLGLVWTWSPRRPEALEADVLAVGHGLAVVIQSVDGRTSLYDCGRMRDPGVGRRIVAPALWERGVTHLDAVILSHADADHYNGLPDLLDRFSIGVVRVPPGFAGPANPGAVRLLEDVRARGVPVRPIVAGDRWEAAGARFSALSPPATGRRFSTDNARSVVLDVESGGRHVLLTGDLEGDGLTDLAERPSRALDAILAPHHGGRSANPPWFYRWARPARVVVSQRPPMPGASDPLAPLAARKIPVLRTWQHGAIRLRWSARGVSANGFRDGDSAAGMSSPPAHPVRARVDDMFGGQATNATRRASSCRGMPQDGRGHALERLGELGVKLTSDHGAVTGDEFRLHREEDLLVRGHAAHAQLFDPSGDGLHFGDHHAPHLGRLLAIVEEDHDAYAPGDRLLKLPLGCHPSHLSGSGVETGQNKHDAILPWAKSDCTRILGFAFCEGDRGCSARSPPVQETELGHRFIQASRYILVRVYLGVSFTTLTTCITQEKTQFHPVPRTWEHGAIRLRRPARGVSASRFRAAEAEAVGLSGPPSRLRSVRR